MPLTMGRIFQIERVVDTRRDAHFTNKFTIGDLFPDEDPIGALCHELKVLTVREYIKTVRDIRSSLRQTLGVTQQVFSDAIGVSCDTMEAWESGTIAPTQMALKMLHLIQEDHTLFKKLQL